MKQLEGDTLNGVNNLTFLAAAQHDRQSFACSPGETYTNFGELFLNALEEHPEPIPAIRWPVLASTVQYLVDDRELERSLPTAQRSNPVFVAPLEDSQLLGDSIFYPANDGEEAVESEDVPVESVKTESTDEEDEDSLAAILRRAQAEIDLAMVGE